MKLRAFLPPLVAVAVALVVVLGYWYLSAPESTKVKVGQVAPDLTLPFVGGSGRLTLSNFRGQPVLLVMFLSGCHICEREIEQIQAIHRLYIRRGLTVLGVSADPDAATREAFRRRHKLTFPVLADDNGAAVRAAYGSWKFPEAYLLDSSGRVDTIWLGSVRWWSDEVRDRIKRLLPPEAEVR
jgi:peroxiredoxin